MIWLGLLFSVFTIVVPMGVLSIARSVVVYRTTGEQRERGLRGGVVLLGLSALWSLVALAQWIAWASPRGALLDLHTVGIGFHVLPVVLGWLPASLCVVLSWPRSAGTDASPPRWARWMDLLWMG